MENPALWYGATAFFFIVFLVLMLRSTQPMCASCRKQKAKIGHLLCGSCLKRYKQHGDKE